MHLPLDPATFLRDHWQRQPLLIRGTMPWINPLDPDELAGLACDEDVEARIVTRTRKTWKVEHGPFRPKRFAKPGKKPWTLLVQAVDHAVPAVASLLDAVRFVPNWRVDDVMVSYASDGGGVGPHVDQYDVFLVQGLGRRRWRVGERCNAATPLRPHDDLRLLADFAATATYDLEPGDMLYLPPGFAHDGIALGDGCMTYSIGFRAPSRAELIGGWADAAIDGLADDDRYSDPALALQTNPGEIVCGALERLHAMIAERLDDRDAFARWVGEYSTAPKYDVDWRPAVTDAAALRARLAADPKLRRNPASRFAFIRNAAGVVLFVDGVAFDCGSETTGLAVALCAAPVVTIVPAWAGSSAAFHLLVTLVNDGSLGA